MIKLLFLCLFVILLTGCSFNPVDRDSKSYHSKYEYRIICIEGIKYIERHNSSSCPLSILVNKEGLPQKCNDN